MPVSLYDATSYLLSFGSLFSFLGNIATSRKKELFELESQTSPFVSFTYWSNGKQMVGPCDETIIGLWSAVVPHFDSKETVTKIMKKSSIVSSQVPSSEMRGKQKSQSTYTLVSDTGCQDVIVYLSK